MTDVTTNEFGFGSAPTRSIGAGDVLNVARPAGIYALETGPALQGAGGNTVTLLGGLYAGQSTAAVFAFGNNVINVGASGSIYGNSNAISIGTSGNNTITNAGQIVGGTSAIVFSSDAAAINNTVNNLASGIIRSGAGSTIYGHGIKVDNDGLIEGANTTGAAAVLSFSGGMTLDNSGTIRAFTNAVSVGTGDAIITNTGLLAATGDAAGVRTGTGMDKIYNHNLIQGGNLGVAISLGDNDDLYDGRTGRTTGEVHGDGGNDTLLGGAFAEVLRGGPGNDVLNGGGGADVLDGGTDDDTYQMGANNGSIGETSGIDTVTSTITRSLGTWIAIEHLILQGTGNINGTGNGLGNGIVGNGGNNVLAGVGGNDTLVGGGGNDNLFGQAGKDNLKGDAGNDRFTFQSVNDSLAGLAMRDNILDLDDAGDDLIDLSALPGTLVFIGQAGFTAANQVRLQVSGADVIVQINTSGTTGAESEIALLNTTIGNGAVGQVNGADFLL